MRIVQERFGSSRWREMVALRHRVLRLPLGLDYSTEQLADEVDQIHLALWQDDVLAGTLLLMPPDRDGEGKLRQMAIRPEMERRGFGTALARRGEDELQRLGATGARLAARESAIRFYKRLGYAVEGASFIEVTLRHRLMRRRFDLSSGAGPLDDDGLAVSFGQTSFPSTDERG